jgi:polyisoprenoid-binding protein YceI
MKKLLLGALSVVALSGISASAQAEAVRYEFDKAHTQVHFTVNHLGFSNSTGRFHDVDGYFTFDQQNPTNSAIDVTIKTASIDMGTEAWDAHMKNADFFDVEKYPDMTFKSTAIEVTGADTANITGDLTILGVTKPAVLAVKHNKTGAHPMNGKPTSGFSATANIKRSEWGMNYGVPNVGDDVQIRIEVEAQAVTAETAAPAPAATE